MGHQYKITGGGYRFVASLLAVVALIVASLIPPSVHVAKADDDASAASVTPTAYAANYGQLVSAINGSQSAVIAITGNIAFTGQITLNQSKKITLVSDASACGTACELTYASASDFSLFNVIGDSSLTFGGGTEDTNKLSFSNHSNGRLVQVGSASDKGTVTINGGTYNNNGSTSNTTGDGNIAYVFKNGNLTINGGDFKNNYASAASGNTTIGVTRSGGSVVRSSGSVTINGGTFEENRTGENGQDNLDFHGGGAIWSEGTLIVNGGSFSANKSYAVNVKSEYKYKRPAGGGAIWAAGRLVVNGGTFQDNWQMGNKDLYGTGGGAIYFGDGTQNESYNGTMIINGGVFKSNRSMQDGGAIFVTWNCTAVFQQGEFESNWSNRLGGAVYTEEDSTSYVTNAVAYENYAGHFGGGLWLCPSGKGNTSEHGGIALFKNKADIRYDSTEEGQQINDDTIGDKYYGRKDSRNYGTTGAGDDFSIMYPNKNDDQSNYFVLSMEWFTGATVTWHDDGQPSKTANGYLYGDDGSLDVNSTMVRPDGGQSYTEETVLNPGDKKGPDYGYGLRAITASANDEEQAKKDAFVKFTDNQARLSGGAFGSNGVVTFTKVYGVKWNKVSSADTSKKLAGSEWLLVAQNDGDVKSGPIHLDFGNATDCTTTVSATGPVSAAPEEGVWCKVPDSVTDSYYSEFKGKYVTVVADNSGIDKDSENGQFLVKGLRNGTYSLKEYRAPDGYVKSEKTYTFIIEGDHYPTISEKTRPNIPLSNNSITNTPYGGVSWSKVDSTDGMTVLSGSEWKLQDANGNDIQGAGNITDRTGKCSASQDNPYQDIDPTKGSFKLTYLSLGTYRLVETKAPDGYDLPDGATVYYTFTIKENDDRMNAKLYKADGVTEVTENKVPNDRTKGSVIWYKTDSTKDGYGDDARLKDSEWSLTQTKDWKDNDIATEERTVITVTDCISDTGCSAASKDQAKEAGKFQLKDLDWGTYELVETKAPAGFKKSETTYTFVIDKDHTAPAEIQIKNGTDSVTGNIITNTPITVNSLPFTGTGSQTPRMFLPYVLGTVGAGLAVGLGLHVARRRMARQG